MSAARIAVNASAKPVEAPRGALLVGLIANFVVDLLAARKARVARRQLARDVAKLYEEANSMRSTSPSLAADLFAAADRAN
jgi:hypothetical protein